MNHKRTKNIFFRSIICHSVTEIFLFVLTITIFLTFQEWISPFQLRRRPHRPCGLRDADPLSDDRAVLQRVPSIGAVQQQEVPPSRLGGVQSHLQHSQIPGAASRTAGGGRGLHHSELKWFVMGILCSLRWCWCRGFSELPFEPNGTKYVTWMYCIS